MKRIIFGAILLLPFITLAQSVPDDYGTATVGTYCPTLSVTMVRGARDTSTNGQVSELQKFLADYYDIDPLKLVTGYFGRITQGYVIQFQKEQGLPAFGIAGSLTRAKIALVCNQPASGSQTNIQTNTQTTTTNTNTAPNTYTTTTTPTATTSNATTTTSTTTASTPPSVPAPFISYTLKQASYYHFSSVNPISNTNTAYELAYVTSYSLNSSVDEIQVHLGGNISDSDVALVYLDKAGVSNPDYNGNNLNDVISQRTVAYTTNVANGIADIHLNPAFQINQTSFPEIVIVFKPSASGKWTAATGIDFYYQGTKFNQNVSIYNPNPTPVTSTTPPPTTNPPATVKATSTVAVWNNVAVTNDETPAGTFDVTGYRTGDLHLAWTGALTHTCQWKATPVANNNGTFYYFTDQSCNGTTTITFLGNSVYISAWTPANGTLNGALTLYP